MNSEHDEERFILERFAWRPIGRLLDIGAYDGTRLSNSWALACRGWEGVCIEPNPSAFQTLLATYAHQPNIALVNAALSVDGRTSLFYAGDVYSSLHEENYQRWQGATQFSRPFYIQTMSIAALGATFGWDFDFINVDAEGETSALVLALPLEACHRLQMLCVEPDGNNARLLEYLGRYGFQEIHFNGLNSILVR